jgi:glycosyltransferase involved in cell wall biosynthesis
MRICYFGAYDPTYSRNQILRSGLAANGAQVLECRVPTTWRAPQRWAGLLWQFRHLRREFDVLLLAEFGQVLFPLAKTLAGWAGRPLVSDLLISMYDMVVNVRQQATAQSFTGKRLFRLEKQALHQSKACLVDTMPHQTYFAEIFQADTHRLHVLPLGVNTTHFAPLPSRPTDGTVRILYYGYYSPAHGVPIMVEAAHLLRQYPEIQFQFVGKGQDHAASMALAKKLALPNVTFLPPVPYQHLPELIASADLLLGEVGDTPQTQKCVANKVYQSLAMGKALINADVPAIRSLFRVGEHLAICPVADPAALANSISALAADPMRRTQLGQAGQAWVHERYSPQPLGAQLLALLG